MGRRSFIRRALPVMLAFLFLFGGHSYADAATLQEIRDEKQDALDKKKEAEGKLSTVNRDIEAISGEQEAVEAEIEELDAQLVDLILSVSILESDIADKERAIERTKEDLEAAKKQVSEQEAAMARRIKFMYERGNTTYLEMFLESESMAEAVNKTEYSEKLYRYDRLMLEHYRLAREEVEDKEKQLEDELAELEEIKEDLNAEKEELDALIAEKKESAEDFAEQLSRAKAKAGEYKNQISQQSENLKKLNQAEAEKLAEEARKKAEEEARRKAEEAAAKKKEKEESSEDDGGEQLTVVVEDNTESSSEEADSGQEEESRPTGTSVRATGSGTGTDIANYGLQFVGCPYVPGGTSLSGGCDCSGFTQGVYSHFGISIPRSSYAQSSGGTEVPFSEAKPGDIIYYGGHVGIYIGNNQIVHASTVSTGIKISSAFYRSIITVRRYW
ncbi:MAG: C40 family peptidase [Lachnospiraceae bacterium]|nr:C40 family peptidase [Lachnospiraceae bacterium]